MKQSGDIIMTCMIYCIYDNNFILGMDTALTNYNRNIINFDKKYIISHHSNMITACSGNMAMLYEYYHPYTNIINNDDLEKLHENNPEILKTHWGFLLNDKKNQPVTTKIVQIYWVNGIIKAYKYDSTNNFNCEEILKDRIYCSPSINNSHNIKNPSITEFYNEAKYLKQASDIVVDGNFWIVKSLTSGIKFNIIEKIKEIYNIE